MKFAILAFTVVAMVLLFVAYSIAHRMQIANEKRAIVMRYATDAEEANSGGPSQNPSLVSRLLANPFDRSHFAEWLASVLEAAELDVQPAVAVGYFFAMDLILWFLVGTVNGGAWVSAQFWALVLVVLLVLQTIRGQRRRREREFEKALPDFLMLLASSLRAGLSLQRGIDAISSEGDGEVERQLRRASTEMAMGVQPDKALQEVADRMHSQDMQWVVVAIGIQRKVGGNLASILDVVAETVNGRESIKQEVRAVSSEGRMSANVLLALPIGMFSFFFLTKREYVQVLWLTSTGRSLMLIVALLLTTGTVWIRSMVNLD
jgi:tight adherence protein B